MYTESKDNEEYSPEALEAKRAVRAMQ